MAGGVGAGAVPLSTIYAHVLGTDASSIISRLIPATAMTNVLAIIGAALVARAGQSLPKLNGNGKLMEKGDLGDGKPREVKPDIAQLGVGLMVALTFFILGQICNFFVPKIHAYAFMIIIVVICKITNILPEYYEDAAIMFNNLIVKNLTACCTSWYRYCVIKLERSSFRINVAICCPMFDKCYCYLCRFWFRWSSIRIIPSRINDYCRSM